MSTIDRVFESLRNEGRTALIPFVTAGDPDLSFTQAVLRRLASCGCAIGEIGLPYSDPIADGPVIQESYTRALAAGVRVASLLPAIQSFAGDLDMPLVTMTSFAIVHRWGMERFVDQACQSGLRGAIVPDLPIEESEPLARVCQAAAFDLIQLVTPTTPPDRAKRIADASRGFLYCVSVTGITGERRALPAQLSDKIQWLREQTSLPLCIGFGISEPNQVRSLAGIADGLIVGSALVRRIAKAHSSSRDEVLDEIEDYVAGLLAALES